MKKLILVCSIIGMALTGFGQQGTMVYPNGSATADTLTNTTAEGPYARIAGQVKALSFSFNVTAISGTLGGKVYLQGATAAGVWTVPYLDSLVFTAGTQNYNFKTIDPAFQYYRLYAVPTGTSSSRYTATYYMRKP